MGNIVNASVLSLSDSMQMYLVTMARLRKEDKPVPLSQLAGELSISPVSVNEMCHRLQEDGLVIYRPYRGASLTEEGQRRANHILRRHRLWEVFLVEKLGFDYDQAHDAACELEHSTPNYVADKLDEFLGFPSTNPQGEPIPRADGLLPPRNLTPLSALNPGQGAVVVQMVSGAVALAFLEEQGLRSGVKVRMIASSPVSMLVQAGDVQLSLVKELGEGILVEQDEKAYRGGDKPLDSQTFSKIVDPMEVSQVLNKTETNVKQIPLHKLKSGQSGVVVHVGGEGAIRRRMMDMGLVPGTNLEVVRVAPLGDPIEFIVKGYNLSLRKSEAKLITVEVID